MKEFSDTEIRIAYENRCYADIIIAIEKDIKKAIKQAKQEKAREILNKIEKFVLEEVQLSEDRLIDYALIVDFIEKEKTKEAKDNE